MGKRLIPALIGCVLFLAWGIGRAREGLEREAAAEAYTEDPASLLEAAGPMPLPETHLLRADLYSGRLFPPDHEAALQAAQEALIRDPLAPRAWLIAARENLLLGREDLARAALERSDQLEPHYPRRRLEAIRLWALLGEPERARENARRVSTLSQNYRLLAAQELLYAGLDAEAVFQTTRGEEMTAAERGELIAGIVSFEPGSLEKIVSLISADSFDDSAFRAELAELAIDENEADLLRRLWALEHPSLDSNAPVLLSNTDLNSPPFSDPFPLGWHSPPDDSPFRIRWVGPARNDRNGRIHAAIPRYTSRLGRWRVASVLFSAGEPGGVRLRFRHSPTPQISTTWRLRVENETIAHAEGNEHLDLWQEVILKPGPLDGPVTAVLEMEARWLAIEDRREDVELEIDGLWSEP